MTTLTIKELIEQVATETGSTKVAAEKLIEGIFTTISTNIKNGNDVVIRNFGSFFLHTRPARKGRNPKTGVALDIPSKTLIKFRTRGTLAAD